MTSTNNDNNIINRNDIQTNRDRSRYRETPLYHNNSSSSSINNRKNRFDILKAETDNVIASPTLNNLANKIKQKNMHVEIKTTPSITYSYPLVSLHTWYGSKPNIVRLFELDEDENQVGPEMRKIYNYMEQVYSHNLYLREININECDYDTEENNECNEEEDCDLYC